MAKWRQNSEKRSFTATIEFEVNEGVALADVALFVDKGVSALQVNSHAASKMISDARVLSVEETTELPDEEEG